MSLASLVTGLSNLGRTNAGYLLGGIVKGTGRGRVFERITKELVQGYDRASFDKDWARLRNVQSTFDQMKQFRKDQTVTRGYVNSAAQFGARYNTLVELKGYNDKTGESFRGYVTVSSDTLLTRQEISIRAEASLHAEDYDVTLTQTSLKGGLRRVSIL